MNDLIRFAEAMLHATSIKYCYAHSVPACNLCLLKAREDLAEALEYIPLLKWDDICHTEALDMWEAQLGEEALTLIITRRAAGGHKERWTGRINDLIVCDTTRGSFELLDAGMQQQLALRRVPFRIVRTSTVL